eukprot:1645939-Heterocapsa_arctica.AAC.1
MADHANSIPAITHATKTYHLDSIFIYGLIPGGGLALGRGKKTQRNASNFNAFPPEDPRNIVGGRETYEFDAVI